MTKDLCSLVSEIIRGLFLIADVFCPLLTFALILHALQWFLDDDFAKKIGFIEAMFHRRYMNGFQQALVHLGGDF
jgi:hypothetical protein